MGIGLAVAIGLTAILLMIPLPPRWLSPAVGKLLDFGHVPLFAALAIVIEKLTGRRRVAILLCIVAAAGAESLQYLTGRTGNWPDLIRGLIGTVVGLQILNAFEPEKAGRRAKELFIAAMIGAGPVLETIPVLADEWSARSSFPVLADFRSRFELERWRPYQATIARKPEGAGHVGELHLDPGPSPYSGAEFFTISEDWSTMKSLAVTFRVIDGPITLAMTIRDHRASLEHNDRFNYSGRFDEGEHTITLPLATIAAGPKTSPLDLTWMRSINLFIEATRARTLDVISIRLE